MPSFGQKSKKHLATCHPKIQMILNEVIKRYDCSVIWGFRDEETQNHFFAIGTSQKQWPNSKHNKNPSRAVDVVPYPTLYEDIHEFYVLATLIFKVANDLGIRIVWGGHWKNFKDYAHWELHKDEE